MPNRVRTKRAGTGACPYRGNGDIVLIQNVHRLGVTQLETVVVKTGRARTGIDALTVGATPRGCPILSMAER